MTTKPDMQKLLHPALVEAGSQKALADQLGVTPVTVHKILRGKLQPSWKLAARIEEVTGIPRSEIRPDIYADISDVA